MECHLIPTDVYVFSVSLNAALLRFCIGKTCISKSTSTGTPPILNVWICGSAELLLGVTDILWRSPSVILGQYFFLTWNECKLCVLSCVYCEKSAGKSPGTQEHMAWPNASHRSFIQTAIPSQAVTRARCFTGKCKSSVIDSDIIALPRKEIPSELYLSVSVGLKCEGW